MPTTVRLDDKTKSQLDRLQAEYQIQRGKRVSHAALISEMLKHCRKSGFGSDLDDEWKPWKPEEVRALMELAGSGGDIGSSEDIDEVLASDEAVFGRKKH